MGATFAVLLVLAGSIWWVRTSQREQARQPSIAAAAFLPRLAVLPFENRTPGEENQALSYAISDSVISRLSKLRGFQAMPWTTAKGLPEPKGTLSEVGDVQYALEGSLEHADPDHLLWVEECLDQGTL